MGNNFQYKESFVLPWEVCILYLLIELNKYTVLKINSYMFLH